jgi:hypothetical protein
MLLTRHVWRPETDLRTPVFRVLAILKECPHVILVVDVSSRLSRLHSSEKPSNAVKLVAIASLEAEEDRGSQLLIDPIAAPRRDGA